MTTLKFPFGSNGDATWEPSSKLLATSLERQAREVQLKRDLTLNETGGGRFFKTKQHITFHEPFLKGSQKQFINITPLYFLSISHKNIYKIKSKF